MAVLTAEGLEAVVDSDIETAMIEAAIAREEAAVDAIRVGTGATGEALDELEASFGRVAGRVCEDICSTATVMAAFFNTGLGLTGDDLEGLTERAIKFARITRFDLVNGTSDIIRLFADARKAIARGFGSVKAALADPPALIGRTERLANMERRFRKVMRNLRAAVEATTPSRWTTGRRRPRSSSSRSSA